MVSQQFIEIETRLNTERKRKIEFGDFQTPDSLAVDICARLRQLGISPDVIVEPTCGIGAFVVAAEREFPATKQILGFEINFLYLETLKTRLSASPHVQLIQSDFFATDWKGHIDALKGRILVLGNFPWVTSSAQGVIGGGNMPIKSNFQGHSGFDAISGKANFDISEWMLLEVLRWFKGRRGDIAMLVKTAVARKVLAQAKKQGLPIEDAILIGINAKKDFGAAVEACLLVIRISDNLATANHDYMFFKDLNASHGQRVGHRHGLTIGDMKAFELTSHLVGQSPQKWRSGVKHDASAVMEFTRTEKGLENGLGEVVSLEDTYLYPLLKGSDVGSEKPWRQKFILVTQHTVGEHTSPIQLIAPKTWTYLLNHAQQLDARGSTIYAKNPRFSIFGIGEYAFRPWRIAICGFYKVLRFRLVGPIERRPVMFDDTVYYLSFDTQGQAEATLDLLNSDDARGLLSSLIFWDEKRPIKTSILNVLDWTRLPDQRPGVKRLSL